MAENKQLNFDRLFEIAEDSFHRKIYKIRNGRGGYLVLDNYQSFLSNLVPLAYLPNHLSL